MLLSAMRFNPSRCADLMVSSRLNFRKVYEASPSVSEVALAGLAAAGNAPPITIAAPERPSVLRKSFLLIVIGRVGYEWLNLAGKEGISGRFP